MARKPLIFISFSLLISFGGAIIFFNYFVIGSQERVFSQDVETPELRRELFARIAEERIAKEEGVDSEKDEDIEDDQGQESKEIKTDEESNQQVDEDISEEELEEVLADTLFELYEFTDGELPSIAERAVVWEDLGLGDREEYRGTYSQNILFLERLIEEID